MVVTVVGGACCVRRSDVSVTCSRTVGENDGGEIRGRAGVGGAVVSDCAFRRKRLVSPV